MSFRVLLVLTLCAALGLCAYAVADGGRATPPSAGLRPAPGWVIVGPSKREQPQLYRSMLVAVTAPDVAAARPFAPFTGFTRLSARGILIWVTTIGRNRPGFEPMRWPPRLSRFRVDRGWEGQPAAHVQQRLAWGAVDGWDIDVRVYFATQHPDRRLLETAQAELDRLLPPT